MAPTTGIMIILLSLGTLASAKPYATYVLDGKVAEVGAWPWMASIRINGIHFCGGVLIKSDVILTAASCAAQLEALGGDKTVILGMHSQNDGKLGRPEVIKISYFVINRAWNAETGEDDLAGAVLSQNATIGRFIKPIDLPKKDFDMYRQSCTVTGWGATGNLGEHDQAELLHQKTLVGWSTNECLQYLSTASERLRCASNQGEPWGPICRYDAGGPLACPVGDGYVLAGINLYWTKTCWDQVPAIFTYVPQYIEWIRTRLLEGSTD